MDKKRSKRIRLGDVYAIPLPDGRYAFGRLFKENSIAVYRHSGINLDDISKEEDYRFVVAVYKDVLQDGKWIIVGNRTFKNDEAWPPPKYIIDKMNGKYSIYYKGEIIHSTRDKCIGLEVASVWDAHHIIDRIMGEEKWTKILK
ncbi:Imm26 family immunity protein [Clostridium estertheticum]|uniref:Imm26 family immunity protein n=1 Tax=Clostridium estertheticum TaxID=238834 RepID=UPI001CF2369E|nr:Imm26 family immunity protein [Clostridium estertheticum]MCB2362509.1 immunity 26/phosphotriesterase HocA family protein [Clostridium estertheticum]